MLCVFIKVWGIVCKGKGKNIVSVCVYLCVLGVVTASRHSWCIASKSKQNGMCHSQVGPVGPKVHGDWMMFDIAARPFLLPKFELVWRIERLLSMSHRWIWPSELWACLEDWKVIVWVTQMDLAQWVLGISPALTHTLNLCMHFAWPRIVGVLGACPIYLPIACHLCSCAPYKHSLSTGVYSVDVADLLFKDQGGHLQTKLTMIGWSLSKLLHRTVLQNWGVLVGPHVWQDLVALKIVSFDGTEWDRDETTLHYCDRV